MCVPSNEDNGRSKSRRADGDSHAGKSRSLRATHVYHLFRFPRPSARTRGEEPCDSRCLGLAAGAWRARANVV